jgi:hypothetical protein
MKTFRTSLAVVAGAALLTLSACGGDSNAEVNEAAATAGEPIGGGTLRFAVGSGADGLTPQQHREGLELFHTEVAPQLRATIPSRPWQETSLSSAPIYGGTHNEPQFVKEMFRFAVMQLHEQNIAPSFTQLGTL